MAKRWEGMVNGRTLLRQGYAEQGCRSAVYPDKKTRKQISAPRFVIDKNNHARNNHKNTHPDVGVNTDLQKDKHHKEIAYLHYTSNIIHYTFVGRFPVKLGMTEGGRFLPSQE